MAAYQMLDWLKANPGIHQSRDIAASLGIDKRKGNQELRELMSQYPSYIHRVGDGVYDVKFPRTVPLEIIDESTGLLRGSTIPIEILEARSSEGGNFFYEVIADGEEGKLFSRDYLGTEYEIGDVMEARIISNPKYDGRYSRMYVRIGDSLKSHILSIEGTVGDYR